MGFPTDFFPLLFAIPRIVGWLAHWREMLTSDEDIKIWRPRQIYTGHPTRHWIPFGERGEETHSLIHSDTHPFYKRNALSNVNLHHPTLYGNRQSQQ